jgi:hypothetical protein
MARRCVERSLAIIESRRGPDHRTTIQVRSRLIVLDKMLSGTQ